MIDPKYNAEQQQQWTEPADNDVCAEHSEPVQEQNEINNPGQHEPDFGRRREGREDGNRCDPVRSNDGRKCQWGEGERQTGRLGTIWWVGQLTRSGQSDTSDFDLDQIQGRRARTIVNGGFAFCETGP